MCSLHFCVVVLSHKHVHVVALIPDSVYTIGRHVQTTGAYKETVATTNLDEPRNQIQP